MEPMATGNSKKFVVKNGLITQNIEFVSPDSLSVVTQSMSNNGTLSFNGTISATAFQGALSGQIDDISNHDTDDLSEGITNLYFTEARARDSVSASGDLTYNATTGIFSVDVPGTNLAMGGSGNSRTITSSTGNDVSVPVATTTNAGFMSTDDKVKIDQFDPNASVSGGAEISSTPPSSPAAGDLWWDSSEGTLYIYYDDGDSQQWVISSPALPGPAGPEGPEGPEGPIGPEGPAGVTEDTNITITGGTTAGPVINSSTGTGATIPTASASASGVITTGDQTIGGVKTFSNRINLDTSDGEIFITPTGWRSSNRAAIKIRSKSDNPAELDLRQTSGSFEPGWHISARGSGENRELQIYRFNMNASGVADSSTFSLVYRFEANGTFIASGNVTAFSDKRVKDNIETIDNALDKVKNLRGVSFTRTDQEDKDKKYIGVIAQEVLEIIPEVVEGSEDTQYSVAYGNIVAVLIEAIKEQQKEIDNLKSIFGEIK